MSEVIERDQGLADQFGARVEATPDEQWSAEAPGEGWTARDVVAQRAVGSDEHLDQDAVGHAFRGLQPMDPMIRQPGVFGPEVEPPEGADLQTQFLCFLGRKV